MCRISIINSIPTIPILSIKARHTILTKACWPAESPEASPQKKPVSSYERLLRGPGNGLGVYGLGVRDLGA